MGFGWCLIEKWNSNAQHGIDILVRKVPLFRCMLWKGETARGSRCTTLTMAPVLLSGFIYDGRFCCVTTKKRLLFDETIWCFFTLLVVYRAAALTQESKIGWSGIAKLKLETSKNVIFWLKPLYFMRFWIGKLYPNHELTRSQMFIFKHFEFFRKTIISSGF